MDLFPEDILKLLFAIVAGGLVGAEREYRDKSAGFRTLIFICVGAAMFTILSLRLSGGGDPARIAANIVSGVGFLGAGVILRDAGRVIGLTTASTIWLVAALGMGIGAGQFAFTAISVLAVMIVLWVFPAVEHRIDNIREVRTYEATFAPDLAMAAHLEQMFADAGLRIESRRRIKSEQTLVCFWTASGSPQHHERLAARLLNHADVREVRV